MAGPHEPLMIHRAAPAMKPRVASGGEMGRRQVAEIRGPGPDPAFLARIGELVALDGRIGSWTAAFGEPAAAELTR